MVTACPGFFGTNVFIIPHVLSFRVEKNVVSRIVRSFSTGQKAYTAYIETLRPAKDTSQTLWGVREMGVRISFYSSLLSPWILG